MPELDIVLEAYRDMFGVKTDRANEIHRLACEEVARLRAAEQGAHPTLLTFCPECGVEQIVTHLPTCAHYVAQSG